MKKTFSRIWSIGKKIWHDPVLSKVIASLIIIIGVTIIAIIKKITISDIGLYLLSFLNFQIPIYIILSLIGLLYLIKLAVHFYTNKHSSYWNEKIGDYTFKDLYQILRSQTLPLTTNAMQWMGRQAPKDDLLVQFYIYKMYLNMGVSLDLDTGDGGYLYGILCPKLVSYGLVERIDYKDTRTEMDLIKYQTTENGNKFYVTLEKLLVLKEISLLPISRFQTARRA